MPIRVLRLIAASCVVVLLVGATAARALERFDFEERYFRDPTATAADHALIHVDSLYHLFYTRGPLGSLSPGLQQMFGHATSPDLVHWTILDPVLPTVPGTWESQAHWAPYIVERPQGTFTMYYTGVDSNFVQQIGVATSTDLLTWTPYAGNPVFHPSTDWAQWSPFTYSNCRDPFVYVDGDTLRMFVTALTAFGRGAIGGAWSTDGLTWTDAGAVALTPAGANQWHQLEACTVTSNASGWHLYYGETNVVGIGMAPAPELLGPWDLSQRRTVDYGSAIEVLPDGAVTWVSRHTAFIERDTLRTTIRFDRLDLTTPDPTVVLTRVIDNDWTRSGSAMLTQPVFSDNVAARHAGTAGLVGNGWIGTMENYPGPLQGGVAGFLQGNVPTGELVSRRFVITGDSLSVLVGGSNMPDSCYVQLCDACTDSVMRSETGADSETMSRRVWDTAAKRGQIVYLRVKDGAALGHINVDDIVELPAAEGSAPAVAPSLRLLAPLAGEALAIGLPDTIRWSLPDAIPGTFLRVLLSVDGGATYPRLLATVAAEESSFVWLVDEQPTIHARFRLLAYTPKGVTACDRDSDDVVISSVAIGNVHVANVTDSTAVVFWTTAVNTDGIVEYGKTTPLEFTAAQAGPNGRVHAVTLNGLAPGQTYYYHVISQGEEEDNGGVLHSFLSAEAVVGSSYVVQGTVTTGLGVPVPGAAVLVTARHEGVAAYPVLAITTATGAWSVDLEKARDPSTGFAVPTVAGDSLRVEMYASPLQLDVLDPVIATGASPQEIGSIALVTGVADPRGPDVSHAALVVDRVWPAPARRAVTLALTARAPQTVTARIVDARGRTVRVLPARARTAGPMTLVWDGNDDAGRPVPSGVYHVVMSSALGVARARVVLAR